MNCKLHKKIKNSPVTLSYHSTEELMKTYSFNGATTSFAIENILYCKTRFNLESGDRKSVV